MREIASIFKVLADEARLKMLWLLFNRRELCVCDFIEVLGITQSKASRHLRILYRAGIVTDRRDGLWVYYALRPQGVLAKGHLDELRADLANAPEAAQLLKTLAAWLRHKEAGAGCVRRPMPRPAQDFKAATPPGVLQGGPRS